MNCNPTVLLLVFGRHLMWFRSDGNGGTTTFYYDDEITWLLAAVALFLLTWFLLSRYLRARRRRRPSPPIDRKSLKRVIKIKRELSSRFLRPGFSKRIHAIGIGILEGTSQYCIQIFINDANEELWSGAGNAPLPTIYRGEALVLFEMPMAGLLSASTTPEAAEDYSSAIRDRREIIIGGISGANKNLTGQSGTIGYFCTRRTKLRRPKQMLLLSNSHVFADLQKDTVDGQDLIMQPSPGEPGSNRAIATLIDYSALRFDDSEKPNTVDAAIAKLWQAHPHDAVIPSVGAVKGFVRKADIKVGEPARKFGRTTGYSEGHVFSICLDIWIKYDRTGRSAFFRDQILVEPDSPNFPKFVDRGDSGSLLVDAEQNALGLIFAGMSDATESINTESEDKLTATTGAGPNKPKRIEGYGVANPISEVLDRLRIDLVVGD
ncbi:MAG TPA: hypothetical protein VF397_14740 [Pyrinomonadaceae bacterium]